MINIYTPERHHHQKYNTNFKVVLFVISFGHIDKLKSRSSASVSEVLGIFNCRSFRSIISNICSKYLSSIFSKLSKCRDVELHTSITMARFS